MECMTPFSVRDKFKNQTIAIPCGKCPACYKRRVAAWGFRLMEEEKVSTSSQFLTLTYDTKFVPITEHAYLSVEKRDLQLFFKRLRKLHPEKRLKYYAVGEYGEHTQRPHYHIILFNAEVEKIQPAWEKGHIYYGTVTGASIAYSLKYMCKKSAVPQWGDDYDDRECVFALMSKGLGENYISTKMVNWHKADLQNRMYCNLKDGKKVAMPRYYKQKIYADLQKKAVGANAKRLAEEKLQKKLNKNPEYYKNKFESDKAAFNKMQKDAQSYTKNKI